MSFSWGGRYELYLGGDMSFTWGEICALLGGDMSFTLGEI